MGALKLQLEEETELEFKDGEGGGGFTSQLLINIIELDNGWMLHITSRHDDDFEEIEEVYQDKGDLLVRLGEVL